MHSSITLYIKDIEKAGFMGASILSVIRSQQARSIEHVCNYLEFASNRQIAIEVIKLKNLGLIEIIKKHNRELIFLL